MSDVLKKAEIVARESATPFEIMDMLDDQQVLAELEGQVESAVLKRYCYAFPQDGAEIVGLSKIGVSDGVRHMATHFKECLRVMEPPMVRDLDGAIEVVVRAGRYAVSGDGREALLDVRLGAKRQSKKEKRRDGSFHDDRFYFEKAVSKAERNAFAALMPEKVKQELIALYRKAGKVHNVAPTRAPVAPAPTGTPPTPSAAPPASAKVETAGGAADGVGLPEKIEKKKAKNGTVYADITFAEGPTLRTFRNTVMETAEAARAAEKIVAYTLKPSKDPKWGPTIEEMWDFVAGPPAAETKTDDEETPF